MDHPLLKWGGIGISVAALVISAVIYLEGVKSQVSGVQYSQDEQAILLDEIQATQAQHFAQREDRFEELEVGQRNIKDTLTTSQDDLFFHVGALTGRLVERDHSIKQHLGED